MIKEPYYQIRKVIELEWLQLQLLCNTTQKILMFSLSSLILVKLHSNKHDFIYPEYCKKNHNILKHVSLPGLPSSSLTLNCQAILDSTDTTLVLILLCFFLSVSLSYLEVTRPSVFGQMQLFGFPSSPLSADYITTAYMTDLHCVPVCQSFTCRYQHPLACKIK